MQSVIEPPLLYMLGAAAAKDSDQLAFIPTRGECLKQLHSTEVQAPDETETVELREKMRFMNGDNPDGRAFWLLWMWWRHETG